MTADSAPATAREEPKHGEWMPESEVWYCPECGSICGAGVEACHGDHAWEDDEPDSWHFPVVRPPEAAAVHNALLAAHRDSETREIERLRAALKKIAKDGCFGAPYDECAEDDPEPCGACRARRALTATPGDRNGSLR